MHRTYFVEFQKFYEMSYVRNLPRIKIEGTMKNANFQRFVAPSISNLDNSCTELIL